MKMINQYAKCKICGNNAPNYCSKFYECNETLDGPSMFKEIEAKKDYSMTCDMNDDNENNPCWRCLNFLFPIGCMHGEED